MNVAIRPLISGRANERYLFGGESVRAALMNIVRQKSFKQERQFLQSGALEDSF